MTAQEWIRATFPTEPHQDDLGVEVFVFGNRSAPVEAFATMFSAAFTGDAPTHAGLSAVVADTGWQAIFDAWRDQGIIA